MGDRALVVFHDSTEATLRPADETLTVVYLHWNGSNVPMLLQVCRQYMKGRSTDLSYTTARFVGICHESIKGNLSLGIWSKPGPPSTINSHGDAGVIEVDVANSIWKVTLRGGYLKANHNDFKDVEGMKIVNYK